MNAGDAVFWIGLGLLLVISLIVGLLRRSTDSSDWLAAGQNISFIPLFGSIVGTMIGGAMFVAIATMGYENGIVGIYIGLAYGFGLVILGLFSGRIVTALDEAKSKTIFHLLVNRVGAPTGVLYALVSFVLLTLALAGQLLALHHFFSRTSSWSGHNLAFWFTAVLSCGVAAI